MANAMEKIVRVLEKVGEVEAVHLNGPKLAEAFKMRKKADIKVIGTGTRAVILETDEGDVFKVVTKQDEGFLHYAKYLSNKSSVFYPELKLAAETEHFVVFKTEKLATLESVVGDEVAHNFAFWASAYTRDRNVVGKSSRKDKAASAPDMELAYYGRLRGLLAKLVKDNDGKYSLDMSADNFMVRNGNQLVVTDPLF